MARLLSKNKPAQPPRPVQEAAEATPRTVASRRQRGDFIRTVEEQKYLIGQIPDSLSFFGNRLELPKAKRREQKKANRIELHRLRVAVNNFSQKKLLATARLEIKAGLEEFPFHPELHALHGVQLFQDASQSGARKVDRLTLLNNSLNHLAIALHNGADSVFNFTWFVAVYLEYIRSLRSRLAKTAMAGRRFESAEGSRLGYATSRKVMALNIMLKTEERRSGLNKLMRVFKNSRYFIDPSDPTELEQSAKAFLAGKKNQRIGQFKRADYILYVYFVLLTLAAHIPCLHQYVHDQLKLLPDVHRDLILQKRSVQVLVKITRFKMLLLEENKTAAQNMAQEIYKYCRQTIDEYLATAVLTKPFETDPFLKLIWVVVESKHVLHERILSKMVGEAQKSLAILSGERGQAKGLGEYVTQLSYQLSSLLVGLR